MSTFDDILSKAALPERTVRLCLNAALLSDLAEAERLAQTAEAASTARNERGAETKAQQAQVRKYRRDADALKAQADEQAVDFRLRALGFAAYNTLVLEHPKRPDVESDKAFGFNTLTLFPALIRACLVEPEVTDEQWERLLSVINDSMFDRLAGAALEINRREGGNFPF